MRLFENTDGKHNQSYGDEVIQLRFKCSKRKNEPPNGELATLLSALSLSENNFLWDVKQRLWQVLKIDEKPIQLVKERSPIVGRNINNAADIPILRNKEGKLLLSALRLPISSTKRNLEFAIIEKVLNISLEVGRTEIPVLKKKKRKKTSKPQKISAIISDFQSLIKDIKLLKQDSEHQERAHESLVESFFIVLGYEKIKEIKHRQGRIDISIHVHGEIKIVVEVKRDWNLTINNSKAVNQAYNYANECGARYVLLTNGDYYAFFDRKDGYSYRKNFIGEFWLSALEEENLSLIEKFKKNSLTN